jgi:hypothetical protein
MTKKRYLSHSRLATLETEGIHLAESDRIGGVFYKPEKDGISIYAGTSGAIAFKWDRWEELKQEIDEFREVYDATYDTGRTMRQAKTKIG